MLSTTSLSVIPLEMSLMTPELVAWLKDCPDVKTLRLAIKKHEWSEKQTGCHECGETYKRKDLRFDEASPIGDSNEPICRHCWDYWKDGTMGDPEYRPPAWPEVCDEFHHESIEDGNQLSKKINGKIWHKETGRYVGTVTDYKPKGHFGHVTLYGMEDSAEYGSLDPDCEVHEN